MISIEALVNVLMAKGIVTQEKQTIKEHDFFSRINLSVKGLGQKLRI